MFQVILLTLIGANNGAREIAKEREVLEKELRAGLSPWAYVTTKMLLITIFSLVQSFWMTSFVKEICHFPGTFMSQFEVLFFTTLAMSAVCLTISSASKSPERASLLSIYLVGLQLPLSGAVLALPDFVSTFCRPFIAAYWGWSGYLKTMEDSPNYDIVHQSTHTYIADFVPCIIVLALHTFFGGLIAWYFVARVGQKNSRARRALSTRGQGLLVSITGCCCRCRRPEADHDGGGRLPASSGSARRCHRP